MNITWNGTGSAWATYYGNSSAVVEAGGKRLLVDCGHTVPGRLRQMGLTLQDIDGVFISHLHGDHVYGLEEWGFRNMLVWDARPRLFVADSIAEMLWRGVLSGTMGQTCDRSCLLKDYFDITVMHVEQPQTWEGFTLAIQPVRHIPNAHAYGVKIGAEGTNVAFTCDSMADADPWFYDDTACVFHDCSFRPYHPSTVHAHFEQLKQYPVEWRSRTWLVHYDDDLREKREQPDWQSTLAATGMRLTAPFKSLAIPAS